MLFGVLPGWAGANTEILGQNRPEMTLRASQASSSGAAGKAAQAGPLGEEVTLDRVVAMVNGDLVLESDVEAERRFAAFQPFNAPGPETREELIERLIDRALIEQQMALQPGPPVTDAEVDSELNLLRKAIPRCAAYHCETEAGWERFRMGIRISPAEVDAYYKDTMLPVYQKANAPAPAEATIADKIQEILLQQRVDKLLDDWLTALRAQGSVRILKPGEEAP
jgi:hypothetical protein